MGFESYYESPFTQQAEAALEGIKRMTELRIVLKEQERSSLNISDMDGFIQDSGRLLRDVAHDNRVFYDANPKALFHDMGMGDAPMTEVSVKRVLTMCRAHGGDTGEVAAG